MKNTWKTLSGVIAAAMYVPQAYSIFLTEGGLSFASYTLWAALLVVTTANTIKAKGNFILPMVFLFGNCVIACLLIFKGQFIWGLTEWITLFMVAICVIIWISGKSTIAILASVAAISISSFPQVKIAWDYPEKIYILTWIGFAVAAAFSIMAGKNWSIKERLYPVARGVFYLLIIVFALKKYI